MEDPNKEVDPQEVFRAAAEEARKVLAAGIPEDVAPSDEPGSSPAVGAESVVPSEPKSGEEVAVKDEPKPEPDKPEGVQIDPEKAWNEYPDEAARKKALAHNKSYAAEMSAKAKLAEARAAELEAKLAERNAPPKEPEVVAPPEVKEEEIVPYDDWVTKALKEPDSDQKRGVQRLANEYNQFLAEKIAPAQKALADQEQRVREAKQRVADADVALKFLQSRKDPALYETDIVEAKEAVLNSKLELAEASNARIEFAQEFKDLESERSMRLGIMRSEADSGYKAEIKTRQDSVSTKKAKEEQERSQREIDAAWESAKKSIIQARGVTDEAQQRFLMDAADGAIVRAANANQNIGVNDYSKFIEEAFKPFQISKEQSRQDAVIKVLDTVAEPTPAVATSTKPNLDAQPTNIEEWRAKARAVLSGKAS